MSNRSPAGQVRKPRAPAAKVSRPDVKVFIAEYIRDPNGRQAAIKAGYSARTADSAASRLLKNVKVREEIDRHHAEVVEKVKHETGITLERVIRELGRIAFFDPRKLFDKDGNPLPITELDDDTVAAVAGLDVLEEYEGSGEDRRVVGYVKKWKLATKDGALDKLMKHLGGYAKDNGQTKPDATPVAPQVDNALAREVAFFMHLGMKRLAANDPQQQSKPSAAA